MVVKSLEELLDEQDWQKLQAIAKALSWSNLDVAQYLLDNLSMKNSNEELYIDRELTVYIAGPYTPYNATPHSSSRVAHDNVVTAINFGVEVAKRGHFPFIPHLSHFMHIYGKEELPYQFYIDNDFNWLEKCDAIFYYSKKIGVIKSGDTRSLAGADTELEKAINQGKLIFFGVQQIPIYSLKSWGI